MRKKGFTLIELLAVIVILAIIAVIATPIITGIIEDAKRESIKRSAEGMMKAASFYYTNSSIDEINDVKTNFSSENGYLGLQYSGEKIPGQINIVDENNISIALYKDGYCVYKGENDENLATVKLDSLENCLKKIATFICKIKENNLYTCLVGNNIKEEFYLLENKSETVTFLKNQNLENSETNTFVEGMGRQDLQWVTPLHNRLLELTSNWTNVKVSLPTKSQVEMVDSKVINGAIFWTRSQVGVSDDVFKTNSLSSSNGIFIPDVYKNNLKVEKLAISSATTVYIWNQTSLITKEYEYGYSDAFQLRPVITVSKDLVEEKLADV